MSVTMDVNYVSLSKFIESDVLCRLFSAAWLFLAESVFNLQGLEY